MWHCANVRAYHLFLADQLKPKQKGMALITALLYLSIISCLVTSTFLASLLQTKISEHVIQETKSFENAESALFAGENAIQPDQLNGQGQISAQAIYEFHQRVAPDCGLYYQIDATGTSSNAKTVLKSVFVFPMLGKNPCVDVPSMPHRVMWYQ